MHKATDMFITVPLRSLLIFTQNLIPFCKMTKTSFGRGFCFFKRKLLLTLGELALFAGALEAELLTFAFAAVATE